jgi:Domain of unknown function (DUF6089)
MLKKIIIPLLLLPLFAGAQRVHVNLFGGIANYIGDLVDKPYQSNQTNPAVGFGVAYEISDHLSVRGSYTLGKVVGYDQLSSNIDFRKRNLNFQSRISEGSLVLEYSLLNIYDKRWTPYMFAGVAFYQYNPYTKDQFNNKVFLQPLGTEGQGLAKYPNRKPYSLSQQAIPFGGGFKYAINDNLRLGVEVGLRKLFTDYLDDVSATYVGETDLLIARGSQAVALSYRGDEIVGGIPSYPVEGDGRGNPKSNDWYYFTGITLSFRIGDWSGGGGSGGKVKGMGCPRIW